MPSLPFQYVIKEKGKIAFCNIGSGFPLLLLHGFPETNLAWHKIIEPLAEHFTVIAPDLPGYGDSHWANSNDEHDFTKRNMATMLVSFMETLGFDSFYVAGHDRGGRVAYRMALDYPARVRRLAVLDIVPALDTTRHLDYSTAFEMHNWLFLAQPEPLPETLLAVDTAFYVDHILDSWAGQPAAINEEVRTKYKSCYSNPQVIHTVCEEYRATETDIAHDLYDQQHNHLIACPVLALWADKGFATKAGHPLDVWRKWANEVTGRDLPCGHFLMEECPEEVIGSFIDFFE